LFCDLALLTFISVVPNPFDPAPQTIRGLEHPIAIWTQVGEVKL
jgi:hypothetical protein